MISNIAFILAEETIVVNLSSSCNTATCVFNMINFKFHVSYVSYMYHTCIIYVSYKYNVLWPWLTRSLCVHGSLCEGDNWWLIAGVNGLMSWHGQEGWLRLVSYVLIAGVNGLMSWHGQEGWLSLVSYVSYMYHIYTMCCGYGWQEASVFMDPSVREIIDDW